MIRVLKESFKNNFPSWLKTYLSRNRSPIGFLNRLNINLANANVEEIDNPKDSKLKDTDYIVFLNLPSAAEYNRKTFKGSVYIYRPQSRGKLTISDVYIKDRHKYASEIGARTLLNLADNLAVLSISQNQKSEIR